MRTKKVAFFHKCFPIGGAERITIDTARYLSGQGYNIYIFVWEWNAEKVSKDSVHSYTTVLLPDKRKLSSAANIRFMVDFIRENKISVWITKEQVFPFFESLKRDSSFCKLVYINHSVPFWEISRKESNKQRKREEGNPVLEFLKWYSFDFFKYKLLGWHRKKVYSIYKRVYDLADKYVVLCEDYARLMAEELNLNPACNKLCVIHNSERPVENVNLSKKKQVLFMGRLSYSDKRVDRLLDIWGMIYKDFPDWELLIVGDGPERSNLERKAAGMGLLRITFAGYSNEASRYYKDASILCLTSTYEGWPLSITEAQANGVVPIAFGCTAGVMENLSPDGESGFIVPPFDLKRYAEVLSDLMKDSVRTDEMRPKLIRKIQNYSIEQIGPLWIRLFDELFKPE